MRGPVLDLAGQSGRLQVQREPAVVGPLRARELLIFDATEPGTRTVESWETRAVLLSRLTGRGRVILAGAIDAWRYRGPAFDRFWTGLIAESAELTGPPVRVTLDRTLVAASSGGAVTVELQSMEVPQTPMTAAARLECGTAIVPIRLWPQGRPTSFSGTFDAPGPGVCVVRARVDDQEGTAAVLVVPEPPVSASDGQALTDLIAARDALAVGPGEETAVAARLRARVPARPVETPVHPMRSPWWIVPFVTLLAAAWRLR
jgi:hypothetical protein